jgi:hypothetical protein
MIIWQYGDGDIRLSAVQQIIIIFNNIDITSNDIVIQRQRHQVVSSPTNNNYI